MAGNVNRYVILGLAFLSVLIIAFDLLQYIAVTRMAEVTGKKAEGAGLQEALYDQESYPYKAQAFFYHAKFATLVLASLLLAAIFVLLLMPIRPLAK